MTAAVHGDTSRNYNRIMNQNAALALYQQNPTSASILPHYHTTHSQQQYLSALQKSTPLRSSAVTLPESQSYVQQVLPKIGHHSLRQLRHGYDNSNGQNRRKSAVELLAESKHFYVKSETVLDRKQQLHHSRLINSSGRGCSSAASIEPTSMSCLVSPSRVFPHQRIPILSSRRDPTSNSNLLQIKLRRLLNEPNKETLSSPEPLSCDHFLIGSPSKSYSYKTHDASAGISNQNRGIFSSPKRFTQKLSIYRDCDATTNDSVFFPSTCRSSQSLPPQHILSDEDLYSYACFNSTAPILTDNYQAISPPAEYAEGSTSMYRKQTTRGYASCRQENYKRGYSHSKSVDIDDSEYLSPTYNINSHKSLPDLHSQASRHSSNSEALSYCSRGNRSNKSNSSMNRDSGGSSGHFTHRSEPSCWQQQPPLPQQSSQTLSAPVAEYRRDSGSSTQHSDSSYHAYGLPPPTQYDCVDCRTTKITGDTISLLDFETPEVPEAFKDDYIGDDYSPRPYVGDAQLTLPWTSRKSNLRKLELLDPAENRHVLSPDKDISPPLGTFKRQKCLRFKPRFSRFSSASPSDRNTHIGAEGTNDSYNDRKPILRSKSDISDRCYNRGLQLHTDRYSATDKQRSEPENLAQLERFFDNIGLSDENYELLIADSVSNRSEPVFFSDVSTVDSNLLPDSTEPNETLPYRPIVPTSAVERNARIIKWLFNCRKAQAL